MKRYGILLAIGVLAGVVLAFVGRRPHAAPTAEHVAADALTVAVVLVVGNGRITPERASAPEGSVVDLAIENRGARAVTVSLAGYEDRLAIGAIAPYRRWTGRFVADRPGDDFAWSVDGAPAGRFDVTGSHLVEGHR